MAGASKGFNPFQVDAAHLAYTILGAFTVIFGLFSLFIKERLYLGEAPIATVVGIILGHYVLKLFDPVSWSSDKQDTLDYITLEVTRVVIALGVFSVGVELPKAYLKRHWRTMFFLLGPAMVWGWLISGLFIWGLVPKLTYKSALVISACLSPTDPILAQAVVGGTFAEKHVPAHIRHMLSAESGANDGAAFPFLYIALYLTLDASPGHAVGKWFYMIWLYEVAMGTVIGAVLGFAARKIMQFSERRKLIDRQSYVAQYVSLAILSIGICTLLGSDDLLAAFACGSAFAWDGAFNKATEDSVFSNVVDLLFNCTAFIYIGAIIPFHDFNEYGLTVWRLIVITILILLFRRLPAILALYRWIPDIKTFREALFSGWFGPMGVGAVFISTLARHHIPHPEEDGDTSQVDLLQETIVPIVMFLVLASVVTHGLSIPFFVSGRRVHSITYTWSRNPSMAANEPAWTTHTTRINQGGDVVVNRDDEDGDIGMQVRRRLDVEKTSSGEDGLESGSAGSSEQTRAYRLEKEATPDVPERSRSRASQVSAYREGHDLVTERRGSGDNAEVQVNIERGVFKSHEDIRNFDEEGIIPEHAQEQVVAAGVPLSRHSTNDSHSTNAMSEVGDDDGDGYRRRPYHWRDPDESTASASASRSADASASMSRSRSIDHRDAADRPTKPIHSYISTDRLKKKPESGWRRFLRVGTTDSNTSAHSAHSWAEEGRAGSAEPAFLPVRTRTNPRTQMARTPTLEPHEGGIPLTRTLSRAVSFAPDAAPSSETAPGMTNYGNAAPGFKKSPSLQMFRSTSMRGDDDADAEGGGGSGGGGGGGAGGDGGGGGAGGDGGGLLTVGGEAAGAGNYGAQAPGFKSNPSLSMFRTSSILVGEGEGEDDDDDEKPSVSFKEPKRPT